MMSMWTTARSTGPGRSSTEVFSADAVLSITIAQHYPSSEDRMTRLQDGEQEVHLCCSRTPTLILYASKSDNTGAEEAILVYIKCTRLHRARVCPAGSSGLG